MTYWAVIHVMSKVRNPYIWSVKPKRSDTIADFVRDTGWSWDEWKKRGYRCCKVSVEIMK